MGGLVGIYMWHGWYLQALGWNARLEQRTVQIVLIAFVLFKCTNYIAVHFCNTAYDFVHLGGVQRAL